MKTITDTGAEALVHAIVRQAVKDYDALRYREECHTFFLSEYFEALTGLKGPDVLALVKKRSKIHHESDAD